MVATALPATRAIPAFMLAMFAGIAAFTWLDVQISLSAIDPKDPSSWPNMAPQVRYGFIPLLAALVLLLRFR